MRCSDSHLLRRKLLLWRLEVAVRRMVYVHLPLVRCEKDPLTCRKEKDKGAVCGKPVPASAQVSHFYLSYQANELQSWLHPWTTMYWHHINTWHINVLTYWHIWTHLSTEMWELGPTKWQWQMTSNFIQSWGCRIWWKCVAELQVRQIHWTSGLFFFHQHLPLLLPKCPAVLGHPSWK